MDVTFKSTIYIMSIESKLVACVENDKLNKNVLKAVSYAWKLRVS